MKRVASYIAPSAVRSQSSKIHGRGLLARASIARGEVVAIKGGHIVDTARLEELTDRLRNSEVKIEDHFHLVALEDDEYEEVMLFLNHSCEPNVGLSGNVTFVAMRDISPGEELTTDYGLFDDGDFEMVCTCGTDLCRGMVTGQDWSRANLQQRYGPYFSAYLRRRFSDRPGEDSTSTA